MSNRSTKPVSFAGVGVQKSASGWLFRALEAHPGIATPADPGMKEVNYFNHHWHLGHGWYERLFPSSDTRPRGEFSVLYALDSDVPGRIRRYNPEMRLVLCLRDPVDRAFSQHRYLVGRGMIPQHLHRFMDAWEANPSYAEQSLYAVMLERFHASFPDGQVLVLDYADVRARPQAVLERLFTHVGVDPGFVPQSIERHYNQSRRPRSALARHMRRSVVGVASALPRPVARTLRRTDLAGRVNELLTVPVSEDVVPRLSDGERHELEAFFATDVRRVRDMSLGVGRDWLESGATGHDR